MVLPVTRFVVSLSEDIARDFFLRDAFDINHCLSRDFADGNVRMDRCDEPHPLVLPVDRFAVGLCRVVHAAHPFRAVSHDSRNGACARRVGEYADSRCASGGKTYFIVPGVCRVSGQPGRYGQPCRGGNGHCGRRARCCFLDVGDCAAGDVERVRRIDAGPVVQAPRPRFLYRRPGLLHATGVRPALDGILLRRADFGDVRFRIQFGAEQHHLCGLGRGFRFRSRDDGRRVDVAHPVGHFWRNPPDRAREQYHRSDDGFGVYLIGTGSRAVQYRAFCRSRRIDRRERFRLGAGVGRRRRRGVDAGH